MIPCSLLLYFYLRILTKTIRTRQRAHSHNQFNRETKLDLTFSIGLFSSLIIFSVSFVPCFILVIFDYEEKLPRAFHLYGRVFILLNSCLNPILYGTTNETFKNGYKNFLNSIFNRKEYEYSLELKQKRTQIKIELLEKMKTKQKEKLEEKLLEIKKNLLNAEEIFYLEEKMLETIIEEKTEDDLKEKFIRKNYRMHKSQTYAFESSGTDELITKDAKSNKT
jgi:hypothetical protein